MAIAFDAISSGTRDYGTDSDNSLTFSHTCSTSSDRILLVGYTCDDGSGNFSSITYGGTAMTRIFQIKSPGWSGIIGLYYLLAPKTGANDIVISFSSARPYVRAGGVSFTGSSGIGNTGDSTYSIGTTTDVPITQSAANSFLVSLYGNAGLTYNAFSDGQTQYFRLGGSIVGAGGYEQYASAGSKTQSISFSGGSGGNRGWAVEVKQGTQVVGPANVKTYIGLAAGSTKSIVGLGLASVKTWNGLN